MIYELALTMIGGVGSILARKLLQAVGSAEGVFAEKAHVLASIPGISNKLIREINRPEVMHRAEEELVFINENKINALFINSESYPSRLREAEDAPIMLYSLGSANLNAKHIISIVGTRKATEYGKHLTEKLVKDLALQFPELLVISGLAYGIDIHAHKQALSNHLPTAGVLAHGLDRIYPPAHRDIAKNMLSSGGALLTDFPSNTKPDKPNFVKRNRIVAGISDLTIVIESATKGGSLITADLAFGYNKEVAAFPGDVDSIYSQGCNKLIMENKAHLITSAKDVVNIMNWKESGSTPEAVQRELPFFDTSYDTNNPILKLIYEQKEMHINQIAQQLNLSLAELSSQLFDLEMDNRIICLPGSVYKLKK